MSESLGRLGVGVELDNIINGIDDDIDVGYTGKLAIDENLETVPFTMWESLAYDLALDSAPLPHIAAGYKLELIQIQELISNPHFQQLLTAKKTEVSKLGDGAAFTVAFRMMANKGLASFMARLTSAGTPDKEFLGLFKQAVELAQLKPVEDSEGGSGSVVIGAPSVTFNISGIPGLEHLRGVQVNSPKPQPVVEEYEEAEVIDDNYADEPAIKLLERW